MGSKTKTSNQYAFSQVPSANIQRSRFDRSHGVKTAFDAGYLVPFFTDEALPGDTFNLNAAIFARMATPIFPLMDNLYLDTHFFAVPLRLVWDNFQKFMGEQDNPGDSVEFEIPQLLNPAGGFEELSLADYFGIPTKQENMTVSSLYHRAYNLIFNDWFRDENLQDSVVVDKFDGLSDVADYPLLKRGKRHDYFTSCLPFPQKGPSVGLPLSGSVPIVSSGAGQPQFKGVDDLNSAGYLTGVSVTDVGIDVAQTHGVRLKWDTTALEADMQNATAATINEIRMAFQIQRLYERDARGGSRYTEILRSHFGVNSPDARLQRPEYLGGGSTPLNIQPVAQTSNSNNTSPQANVAGYGTIASNSGHSFSKSFTEHCIIIGLVSVRADLNYQQGLHKQWSRLTKHDFFWPSLAHIGEQAVLLKEIYVSDVPAEGEVVFGYQERFAEYRYKPSLITGPMRSNIADSLDVWHLAQEFDPPPLLNATFIEEDPPMQRVVAVGAEPEFILDAHFSLQCARPMPMFGTPGNMDRF